MTFLVSSLCAICPVGVGWLGGLLSNQENYTFNNNIMSQIFERNEM